MLEEALNIAYDDDIEIDEIFIEPPNSNVLTDEDSGEGDQGGLVNNLNRQQAQALAPAEIRLHQNSKNYNTQEDDVVFTENNFLSQAISEGPGKTNISWMEGDLVPSQKIFPKPGYTRFRHLSPVEVFEKFIDDSILQFLVDESNKYALFLNHMDPKISLDEMKCCIAILILTDFVLY
ncbi:hypothetical protein NQ318_017030 [Aromia moschata]|uniref:PiggyBac transposable element-derived protein domain-containing protein n=1 Tax=Aromia moschata TaxID=1265417 RepID=A0AAV8XEP0_9CUCU|nr:hypothetical protein NQ318_017030 [Aromia moschata]